ncbi:MAG TPA: FGGY family carbohydrate kinase [Spirochaetia bacterium]|nr:FGGY family carbohydrate kinase [Spirochaetia bacterium]
MSLLGVDMGSSSCKAAVFTPAGETLCSASRSYSMTFPGPAMAEMDPRDLWNATVQAVREAAAAAEGRGDPVQALAISAHGETFIPVNATGDPVCPAIMNIDNRAVAEAAWWERTIGKERLYGIVGTMAHPMYSMTKVRWLQLHRPEVVSATAQLLGPGEYVLRRMGLPPLTDFSLACRWLVFDIHTHRWSDELLAAAGVSRDRLPRPVAAGTAAGRLSAAMAREMGVPAGTIVAVGGHDQACCALGAGAIGPGVVSDSAGTYECFHSASPAPCLGPASFRANLNSYCHVVPDTYVTLAFFPSGIVVRWFLDRLAEAESARAVASGVNPHEWFESRAPADPSGLTVTPHLIGACNPHWNPRATVAVTGLTGDAGIFHLYKGILEGIACEFALNADVLEEATAPFTRVRVTGGGTGSRLGLRLRAALSGKTVETLRNPEAVCLGAAILAGTAAGVYRDVQDGVAQAVRVAETVEPEPELARSYETQVARYRMLYPALAPVFDR